MKPRRFLLVAVAALAAAIPQAMAQNYIWDTSTTAGVQNGNGTWGVDNFWASTTAGTNNVAWTNNATAWFGGNSTVAASPSGNFTVTVNGTQTAAQVRQIINGAGDFTLTGGTLALAAGGVRADRGTFTVNSVITNSATNLHLNVQSATGLLIVGGNNTYTATSEIRGLPGGTVRLNNAGALGTGSSVLLHTNSVLLDLNGFDISSKTITIRAGQTGFLGNTAATKSIWSGTVTLDTTGILRAGGTNAEVEISGIISGSTGSLQSFDGGTLRLSGDNTYSGGTSVRDGSKLIVGHTNALGSVSATNIIQAATLDLNGFDIGSRIITLQDNASRLVNDNTNAAAVVSGPVNMLTNRINAQIGGAGNLTLSGAMATQDGTGGGFTKVGAGTLTLAGSSAYSGTTTVNEGTLAINGNQSAATGALTVQSGATLSGSGTIGGATTINGRHSPGNSPGIQTFNNGLTYNNGATFVWELTSNTASGRGTVFDGVNVTGGALSINTGVASDLVFNATGSSVDWSDAFWGSNRQWLVFDNASSPALGSANVFDTINVGFDSFSQSLAGVRSGSSFSWEQIDNDVYLNYTIPEPSTYALLVLAAAGLAAHVVRRRRSA